MKIKIGAWLKVDDPESNPNANGLIPPIDEFI